MEIGGCRLHVGYCWCVKMEYRRVICFENRLQRLLKGDDLVKSRLHCSDGLSFVVFELEVGRTLYTEGIGRINFKSTFVYLLFT